jgi:SAM-dependent methyltransferase
MRRHDGARGWDEYARYYDWENARTLGRRDIQFWRALAAGAGGRVLELGCGTGRLLAPLARSGADLVGVDRSTAMLARAAARLGRLPRGLRPPIVRGDIRSLPFRASAFDLVIAPYGMLQSVLDDGDLDRTLSSVRRVLAPGGTFGVDLVPDLPRWREYDNARRLTGRSASGSRVSLVESVRQDRRRGLTIFDERFIERAGGRTTERRFSLTFRTVPLPNLVRRLERRGFRVEAALGGYDHRPWDEAAEVWILLARRAGRRVQS